MDTSAVTESLLVTLPNRAMKSSRGYTGWAPGDDYMAVTDKSWRSTMTHETWTDFYKGGAECWDSDLNVIADYYFEITHDCKNCEACDGSGMNLATKQLADDYYDFSKTGRRWVDRLTQDEVDALCERGRILAPNYKAIWDPKTQRYMEQGNRPTADWVNNNCNMHDGINRCILIEHRAKRLGVWGKCEHCEQGSIRLGPDRLTLNLWLLHPRKGASRGVRINDVPPSDLPQIKAFLRAQWETHRRHFAWALTEENAQP